MIACVGAITVALFMSSCNDGHDHEADKAVDPAHQHREGPHGGEINELGSVAHIETVHSPESGEIRIFITGPDAKSPLAIETAPQAKFGTDAGPQVIDMNPAGGSLPASEFAAKHEALAAEHPSGRLSIRVGGLSFNPDIEELHHHDDGH